MTTGEMFAFAAVLLLAVLVGAVLPVLYQAARALRALRALLDDVSPRLERALDEATRAASAVERLAADLEEEGRRLRPAADAVAGLGRALSDMGASARRAGSVLGALAPTLVAAVRSFLRRDSEDEADVPPGAEEGAVEDEGGSRPRAGRGDRKEARHE